MTLIVNKIRPRCPQDDQAFLAFIRRLQGKAIWSDLESWQKEARSFERTPTILCVSGEHGQLIAWAYVHYDTDISPQNRQSMVPCSGLAYIRQLSRLDRGNERELFDLMRAIVEFLSRENQGEIVFDLPHALGELSYIRTRLQKLALGNRVGGERRSFMVSEGGERFDRFYLSTLRAVNSLR